MNFGRASKMVKQYSEAAVQRMMQEVGQGVCSHIREHDVAIRYGLTDVALVLAETNQKNAMFAVEKLRRVLSGVYLPGTQTTPTFSAGVAEAVLNPAYDSADIVTELINRAEAALQTAIHAGGNRVETLECRFQPAAMAS
jgi:diguanylate cyclase (GGDEF)-like protein